MVRLLFKIEKNKVCKVKNVYRVQEFEVKTFNQIIIVFILFFMYS